MSENQRPRRPIRTADDEPPPYAYGRTLPSRRAYGTRYAQRLDDAANSSGARFIALLFALAVAGLSVTHGLWQVTAPDTAGRILRAILPPLTDLDQTLAANQDALREVAAGLQPGERVAVRGLPLTVELTREEAQESDTATLHSLVLTRMSETLYRSGSSAFRAQGADTRSPSLLGTQWVLRGTLNLLTQQRHDQLRIPHLAAMSAAMIFALLTLWLHEGPARLTGPGASLIAGAILTALSTAIGWAIVYLVFSSGDVVDDVVRRVTRAASLTVLVVALTFGVLGVIITGLGMVARRIDTEPPMRAPST